jgi:hypothetical protein
MGNETMKPYNQRKLADGPALAAVSYMTLDEAERAYSDGRITDSDMRWVRFFHCWGAPRFSGFCGMKQDRAYKRLGKDAYYRRFKRVNALLTKWKDSRF